MPLPFPALGFQGLLASKASLSVRPCPQWSADPWLSPSRVALILSFLASAWPCGKHKKIKLLKGHRLGYISNQFIRLSVEGEITKFLGSQQHFVDDLLLDTWVSIVVHKLTLSLARERIGFKYSCGSAKRSKFGLQDFDQELLFSTYLSRTV